MYPANVRQTYAELFKIAYEALVKKYASPPEPEVKR